MLLTVVAEMFAREGKEDALRAELLKLIEPTRKEDGCHQYDLHESTDRPGHFIFYENWTSKEHLDRHAASAHIASLRAMLPDLVSEQPRILTFHRIA